jgi:hypothetical protein
LVFTKKSIKEFLTQMSELPPCWFDSDRNEPLLTIISAVEVILVQTYFLLISETTIGMLSLNFSALANTVNKKINAVG